MRAGVYILEFELNKASEFQGPYVFTKLQELLEEVAEIRAGIGYANHAVIVHCVSHSIPLEDLK